MLSFSTHCDFTLAQEATERQIAVAMQLLHGQGDASALGAQGLESKLQGVLKGLDDAHFVTLQGSYNIWQEVRRMPCLPLARITQKCNCKYNSNFLCKY
jgi:hypothetical protein